MDHHIQLSRTISFDAAIQVARISQCQRKCFNTCRTAVSSMQQIGTAATALIASIARLNDPLEQVYPLQHLRVLMDSLGEMAYSYPPAKRMLNVLDPVINDFGWTIESRTGRVAQKSPENQPTAQAALSIESRLTPTDSLITRAESHDADMAMLEFSSNTLKPMEVSFEATGRLNAMSQALSTPGVGYHHDQDFATFDAALMLTPQSDFMQHLTGPQADRPALPNHTPLLEGSLPMPGSIQSSFGKIGNAHCGSICVSSHRLSPPSTADLAEQLSWDDIFRQTIESVA